MFHTHPSSCISQPLISLNIFFLRTSDFAAWFAQQLLHGCTRPLLAHLSTSPASSNLPVSASAPLALLVETPLAIPATSGSNPFLPYNVSSHLPALPQLFASLKSSPSAIFTQLSTCTSRPTHWHCCHVHLPHWHMQLRRTNFWSMLCRWGCRVNRLAEIPNASLQTCVT
jgi:hypothetical protein